MDAQCRARFQETLQRQLRRFQTHIESCTDSLSLRIFCPELFSELTQALLTDLLREFEWLHAQWKGECDAFAADVNRYPNGELLKDLFERGMRAQDELFVLQERRSSQLVSFAE